MAKGRLGIQLWPSDEFSIRILREVTSNERQGGYDLNPEHTLDVSFRNSNDGISTSAPSDYGQKLPFIGIAFRSGREPFGVAKLLGRAKQQGFEMVEVVDWPKK